MAQEPASLPKKTLSHTSPVHPAIQISDCSSDATYDAEQEIAESQKLRLEHFNLFFSVTTVYPLHYSCATSLSNSWDLAIAAIKCCRMCVGRAWKV